MKFVTSFPLSGNGTDFREFGYTGSSDDISGCWIAATGLQTTPLNYPQAFIADYIVGITVALLQTVLSLTVLTIHSLCRLS
jgi:hypothetical protein